MNIGRVRYTDAEADARIALHNDLLNAHLPLSTLVLKTADKVLNNVAVLENDNHLFMTLGNNEIWLVEFHIISISPQNADIQYGLSYPIGCTINWGTIGAGATIFNSTWGYSAFATAPGLLTEAQALPIGTHQLTVGGIILSLLVVNGANDGVLTLQWCQNTAQIADTTVFENSFLLARRIL